ncbi:hypothetical protein [Clostridium ihumii]|nr:hypothetical protein [Clostridium ihumii]
MKKSLIVRVKVKLTCKQKETCNILMGKSAYVNKEPKRKIEAYNINA